MVESSRKFKLHHTGIHNGKIPVCNHAHEAMELIYIYEGECSANLTGKNDSILHAAAGSCMIIPPHVEHDQTGSGKTVFICFSPAEDIQLTTGMVLDLNGQSMLQRWFEDLLSFSHNMDFQHKSVPLLTELIWNAVEPQCRKTAENNDNSKYSARLNHALRYISNFYHHQISAHDIADYSRSSVTWLNLEFNARFDCSLMHYVTEFRLNIARQMLNNDYLSLEEIAEKCGFSNANYFIRVFRNNCGCTPGEFRRRLQAQRSSSPAPEKSN